MQKSGNKMIFENIGQKLSKSIKTPPNMTFL